ncbi:MAG: HEAT repeat domain-containing protein [Acidobacteriota bacterium]
MPHTVESLISHRANANGWLVSLILMLCGFFLFNVPVYGQTKGQARDREKFNRLLQSSASSDPAVKTVREGRDLIAEERWAKAMDKFSEVVKQFPKSEYMDDALYWLAFTMKKQSMFQDANQVLGRLLQDFPDSNWNDDARLLQLEIARQIGDPKRIAEEATKLLADTHRIAEEATRLQIEIPVELPDNLYYEQPPEETGKGSPEEIKIVALQSLFEANPERALALVNDILKPNSNASRPLKESAITLLSRSDSKQAVPILMDLARSEQDPKLRAKAIARLSYTKDPRVLGFLKDLVLTSQDSDIARTALGSLCQFEKIEAHEPLVQIAKTAKSAEIRKAAISCLSNRASDITIDELVQIYEVSQDIDIRLHVINALTRRSAYRLAEKSGSEDRLINAVLRLYEAEKEEKIKMGMLDALGNTKHKLALKKLMEIAKGDTSFKLRARAIYWLGKSNDPEATKLLEDILKRS